MSHYTMLYIYGKRTLDWACFFYYYFYFSLLFHILVAFLMKIPLALIGNDIITASVMCLVRYLPYHIQRTLVVQLLTTSHVA